ncbi:MAG: hypothetical protein M0D54_05505 [Hyphomonadaceae bacterium JAD_PAG50586_4]|nr:MAG: hypothetical protein M0D54_05505 [Hyphomonadaceae bacterium JAD_PAG50586_4]
MNIIKSVIVAALASTALVGAAYARDAGVFTVKLDAPVAERTQYITQNTIWTCEGDTCRARAQHAASVRACRQFVREAGARVVAYGPEGGELSADELARCNGDAAPITQQAAN